MCRAMLLLSLISGLSNSALAVPARSWTVSSAEEFLRRFSCCSASR